MDVILRTGFDKITHSINFHPATEPKAIKLFHAEHVRCVQEYRHEGVSLFIQAEIVRQANVHGDPYKTQLNIDPDRRVKDTSCTCSSNQSGCCKHLAALIYYVNNYQSLSKTDFEQQWGKPTAKQFAKEKYSKGANFSEMFKSPMLPLQMELDLPDVSELTSTSPLQIMLSAEADVLNQPIEGEIENLLCSVLDTVESNLRKEDCEICILNISNFIEDYSIHSSCPVMSDSLNQFFKSYIVMSTDQIIELCIETIDQASSAQWKIARSYRFSASSTIHKIKTRKTKTIESLLKDLFFPSVINTHSVQYGKKNEGIARQVYETMTHTQVKEVGVIVSHYQPWLCASPDGIVIEDGCIVALVEIKCPSSCEKIAIVDYKERKCNVNYLKLVEDEVILKTSHVYYTQCQVQMYVCGLNLCYLFVYSPVENGSIRIAVDRDEYFLRDVILKSEAFYFQHFLPLLYSKVTEENVRTKTIQPSRIFTGKNIVNTM